MKKRIFYLTTGMLVFSFINGYAESIEHKEANSDSVPVISTTPVKDISRNTVVAGGTVTSDRGSTITKKGICWSTAPGVDTTGYMIIDTGITVSFSCYLTNLEANTIYYLRAYAVNSVGVGYGDEITFTTLPEITYGSVTDIEGNIYKTVRIGNQNWMAENIRTTKYADGTPIEDGTSFKHVNYGSYYFLYDNDPNYKDTYGLLYTWAGATHSAPEIASHPDGMQGVCPTGWHIPSRDEIVELINFLVGREIAGGKLKEAGLAHWDLPNEGATNESGLTALAAGAVTHIFESTILEHIFLGKHTAFWSSYTWNSVDVYEAYTLGLSYNSSGAGGISDLGSANSVRCIEDTIIYNVQVPVLSADSVVERDSWGHISAEFWGTLVSDGGSEVFTKGVCLSMSPFPDINDYYVRNQDSTLSYKDFTSNLDPNTTYYFRAFAINRAGIGYSNVLSIKTIDECSLNINNGICGYYPFDGNANEAIGSVLNGIVNGATLTEDRFGNKNSAYLFNGLGNSITVNDRSMPEYATTVTCWVKPLSTEGIQNIISKHNDASDVEILIRTINDKYAIGWTIGGTYFVLSDTGGIFAIDPDKPRFDFLALVYDGKQARFYINDSLVASKYISGSIAHNNVPMTFGRYAGNLEGIAEYFNGVLDDVRIYCRGLNKNEFKGLYCGCPLKDIMFPIAADVSVCEGQQIPDLTASGENIQWYGDSMMTSLLHDGNIFASGQTVAGVYTYYVTQTNCLYKSAPDTVTLTINRGPAAVLSDDLTLCEGDTSQMLQATGEKIKWYYSQDSLIDARDGKRYNVVRIGNQFWMTDNLNVGTQIDGALDQSNNSVVEKYCYDNNPDNCTRYGGLYQWNELMDYSIQENAQGICPSGWHVPSHAEWKQMETALGMYPAIADSFGLRGSDQGTELKAGGSSGFDALMAGKRSVSGAFGSLDSYCTFWNSDGFNRTLGTSFSGIYSSRWDDKSNGFSLRCICNDTSVIALGNTFNPALTIPGHYSYHVTQSVNGCESAARQVNLTVASLPAVYLGEDTAIYPDQSFRIGPFTGDYAYLWNDGSQNPYFEVSADNLGLGSHEIYTIASDTNGCNNSDTVIISVVSYTGTGNLQNHISLVPNPTTGSFSINLDNEYANIVVTITTPEGRVLQREERDFARLIEMKMDVPRGIYLINITADNQHAVFKIVKN